jgi:integrase
MRDLTAMEVNALRRKPGVYRCAPGLYLSVRPSSGGGLRSSWVFRFEKTGAGGKRVGRHMGLGSAADFTLAEARERARKARQFLAEGIDPLQAKRDKKATAKLEAAKALTFGAAAKQLVDTHRLSWRSSKHAAQWRAVFEGSSRASAATAVINDLPVGSIDTGLALKVLEPIWAKTPETASRVRQRCEAVINWASARGFREGPNPFQWKGHLDHLLPQPKKVRSVRHHAALPFVEIAAFMAELRERPGIAARALEFTILTACRTSEAINAVWSEIDLSERTWTIPAERMKAGKPHKVPLCDALITVLEGLPREDGTSFLFLGARKGRPLSNMAMLELLKGMRPGLTVHGFRSTFRVWTAERTAFPHFVCEAALAHTIPDAVERAYQRSDLFEKRAQLMSAWAKYCASPPAAAAGNVVSLKADAS